MTSLLSTLEAGVCTLTFNRPERANAFNFELVAALLRALDEAARLVGELASSGALGAPAAADGDEAR